MAAAESNTLSPRESAITIRAGIAALSELAEVFAAAGCHEAAAEQLADLADLRATLARIDADHAAAVARLGLAS